MTITVSTTPQIKRYLEHLVRMGLWGRSIADAADRLLGERITQLLETEGQVGAALRSKQKEILAELDDGEAISD